VVCYICRDQLRRVFNIQYTPAEFGALVNHLGTITFYPDAPPSSPRSPVNSQILTHTEERIHCASFLVKFFRMGFKERTDRLNAKNMEKKRIAAEKEAKRLADLEELEHKNAMKCSMDFTRNDQERALRKLREAAKLYDKSTPAAMTMKSFEVAFMQPHVFKEQLKRVLNLNLTPKELGGLMRVYDGVYL
jgi:type I site-specific restriction endonuclease